MRRRTALLVPPSLLCLLLAGPAAAAPAAVEDPCGDTAAMVYLDPMVSGWVGVGPADVRNQGPRVDAFDVREARVQDLREGDRTVGVEVVLELCGDLPEPGPLASRWAVAWDLPARAGTTSCYGEVRVTDGPVVPSAGPDAVVAERSAYLSETCSRPSRGLLGEGSTASAEYDVELDDWTAEGSTITWRLRRTADLGPGADQLVAGTTWGGVRADARDGQQGTKTQLTVAEGDVLRASGPGAEDEAGRGGDFVVG